MANSKEISDYKKIIINSIIKDYELVKLIDTTYINETTKTPVKADALIYKKIFPYFYNPKLITEVISFIMIKIDTPRNKGELIKEMSITITAVCNQDIMYVNNGLGTRTDQMGACIDRLFNARDDLGFGYLELASSYEGSLDERHRFRELKFKVDEFNINRCNNER